MTARPIRRKPIVSLPFVADLHTPCLLPSDPSVTEWVWHIEAPDYCVAVAIEAHLIADLAQGAVMSRVSLLPTEAPRRGTFFEFEQGDYMSGRFELPPQVVRAEVRLRYVGHKPTLIVERVGE